MSGNSCANLEKEKRKPSNNKFQSAVKLCQPPRFDPTDDVQQGLSGKLFKKADCLSQTFYLFRADHVIY